MIKSLPNNKIVNFIKLKVFADNKINVALMMISVFEWVENSVGKGEKCWQLAFSPFPTLFAKGLFLRVINPLPDAKILDWSKFKQFEDDNFKFDENSRKFSKWVENTVGKGEIARYEQFLLFPQCFQKACFPGASKGVIVLE